MTEASDGLLLVEISRRRLHPPDRQHLVVILHRVILRQGEGRGGTGVEVVQLVRLKNNTVEPVLSDILKEKLTQLHFYQVRILLSGVCY